MENFHDRVIRGGVDTDIALDYINNRRNYCEIISWFPISEIVKIDNAVIFAEILRIVMEYDNQLDKVIAQLIDMPNRLDHLLSLKVIDLYGDDLEDLRLKALDFLAQGISNVCKVYITKDFPLKDVLLNGFVPFNLKYANTLRMEQPDCPAENFSYMQYEQLKEFNTIRGFQMFTEDYAKLLINPRKSTSFLRWTYPNLLYSSQRIKTDMSMYRVPFSNRL